LRTGVVSAFIRETQLKPITKSTFRGGWQGASFLARRSVASERRAQSDAPCQREVILKRGPIVREISL
jgi:hypothetical protein